MVSGKQFTHVALSLALVGVGMEAASGTGRVSVADAQPATVTVNAGAPLGTIPTTAFGINNAVWDGNLLDANLPGLLQQAGVKVMRYPGGSTSDVYHWQSNTTEPNQSYANPSNTFDAFMGVVQQTGAQAMITVNYGSGTPQEAAGWVQYANKGGAGYTGPVPSYQGASPTGHTYGITYWEIGNELYGNNSYGADWEYDLYTKGQGPVAYGQRAMQFITAMKAVDPSIKVGVVLTAPGNWPDQEVNGTPPPWNPNVLQQTCGTASNPGLDFAIVHWYAQGPGNESDAGLLASPENGSAGTTDSIATMVQHVRAEIAQNCPARASQIQIMVTETNSVSYNPGKQTVSLVNALFLADNYMDWLENGVANVDWWDTHNGITTGTNDSSTLYGTAQYGDYGVLSNGSSSGGLAEPPAETPFPPYYALQMLSKLGVAGDQMVTASSDQPLLAVHAVRQANGDVALLLINKSPTVSYTANLALSGFSAAPNPVVYSYGMNSASIVQTQEHGMPPTRALTVPPYSLTTIELGAKPHCKVSACG